MGEGGDVQWVGLQFGWSPLLVEREKNKYNNKLHYNFFFMAEKVWRAWEKCQPEPSQAKENHLQRS